MTIPALMPVEQLEGGDEEGRGEEEEHAVVEEDLDHGGDGAGEGGPEDGGEGGEGGGGRPQGGHGALVGGNGGKRHHKGFLYLHFRHQALAHLDGEVEGSDGSLGGPRRVHLHLVLAGRNLGHW